MAITHSNYSTTGRQLFQKSARVFLLVESKPLNRGGPFFAAVIVLGPSFELIGVGSYDAKRAAAYEVGRQHLSDALPS